jgi:hypothetical protein
MKSEGQAHESLRESFPVFDAKKLITPPASSAPLDSFINSVCDD